jgi:hypothetical protein
MDFVESGIAEASDGTITASSRTCSGWSLSSATDPVDLATCKNACFWD